MNRLGDINGFMPPDDAIQAGKDCALNGPDSRNAHWAFFATHTLYVEWTKSYRDNNGSAVVLDRLTKRMGNRLWHFSSALCDVEESAMTKADCHGDD